MNRILISLISLFMRIFVHGNWHSGLLVAHHKPIKDARKGSAISQPGLHGQEIYLCDKHSRGKSSWHF